MDDDDLLAKFYTPDYVQAQSDKHRARYQNYWKNHIRWAKDLVDEYGKEAPATLLDLGCSVGTYAIEFALDGYETIGLDFDPKALDAAQCLAAEVNVSPKWLCENARSFELSQPVDIVICFDLLEHLDNQTIRAMLNCAEKNLAPDGIFIFHTFPTKYDHIFYKNLFFKRFSSLIPLPLILCKNISDSRFTRVVEIYSALLDLFSVIFVQKRHQQIIQETVHPNPLSQTKLLSFLIDAGFEVVLFRQGINDFNPLKRGQGKLAMKFFADKTVAQRSLWGAARKSRKRR